MPSLIQPTLFDLLDVSAFPRPAAVTDAIETLASNSSIEARGAIFTRIEVVDFILDLVGYVASEPLHHRRILEPSFGEGDFLLPIVERLLAAWREHGGNVSAADVELGGAVRGVELHKATFFSTHKTVVNRLVNEGISTFVASALADQWLIQGDFLLERQNTSFDFVVGNPPYVRQELIPAPLLSEYRRRYQTMYDRADLYIPFIEHSLSLLDKGGALGFICADRWMKNRYGGPLREFIARGFHLKAYVDMVDTNAFHSEVSAYPAITVITKSKTSATRIAHRPEIDKKTLACVAVDINSNFLPKDSSVREIVGVVSGSEPWLLESSDQMSLIRRIESQFSTLEQAGCKVGIGVATGADKAFIGKFDSLDVETDRKLPLVATRDIQSGEVVWQGQGVINPFADDGGLVDLRDYPKLASYLEERKSVIAKRHCAQKAPSNWYRTIDRIWPELTRQPKLLIPDIKGEAHIVFEPGKLYPHHNLYYVVSDTWDLRALQAVLLSGIAKLFVATYSTKMRGGYLRFQAQYLRRIRIPFWQDVSENLRRELIHAATTRDLDACNRAVFKLYNLNQEERSAFGGNGE
ncbi:Eco57I restriction-modification methylase domain-containing protein [Desulfuromonas carbonis]|uniref:Eco57I restriction-modification methylase domain-containing protein n=1 Tax=Desulfuromonas sp. DDH964 TaxID=1823759 RepID=UPI00078E3844|nr:Eco57I restriction-modification methylase domain-containing protein [Desulfuromonas sp. DDH964]AMV72356.1 Modification methylase PaeR7I [Desulfuromonas sp. DDH964]